MAFTEFCCRSGGSNLNAGTRTGSSTEPGTSADLTYASGNWVNSTGVFTVASGDPVADGVAVGDFASVYADGSTVTGFVGRVTARTTTTITVSGTVKSGTKPSDGTGDRTLKIGGAWKGPNGAEAFPFGFADGAMKNVAGDAPRVNFKNDAQYDITAAMTQAINNGPAFFFGYSSGYGDGGRFTVDGGTSGASYKLLQITFQNYLEDAIFQNNGATGSATGIQTSTCAGVRRVCVNNVRGDGISQADGNQPGDVVECETYKCNQSNTANLGGIRALRPRRCVSHHNDAGTNCHGFVSPSTNSRDHGLEDCIAHANGGSGSLQNTQVGLVQISGCDFYDNDGAGVNLAGGNINTVHIENSNFLKNGTYGIDAGSNTYAGRVQNCGFGAGTYANTSGATRLGIGVVVEGSVTYTSNTHPWTDPDDGDFSIPDDSEAAGAGRGSFLQTQSGYGDPSPTVANNDIGAGQHADPAGGGGGAHPVIGNASAVVRGQTA